MTGSIVESVLAGMATFLFLHVAIWRAMPSNSPRMFLLSFLAALGLLVSWIVSFSLTGFNIIELCAVLWIDSFAVVFYMFVYAGLARSVSVTLLTRLLHCSERPLDFNTLVEEYTLSSRFEDRIRLMHKSGLVRLSEKSVMLTRNGLLLGRGAKVLGQVIGDGLQG